MGCDPLGVVDPAVGAHHRVAMVTEVLGHPVDVGLPHILGDDRVLEVLVAVGGPVEGARSTRAERQAGGDDPVQPGHRGQGVAGGLRRAGLIGDRAGEDVVAAVLVAGDDLVRCRADIVGQSLVVRRNDDRAFLDAPPGIAAAKLLVEPHLVLPAPQSGSQGVDRRPILARVAHEQRHHSLLE